MQLFLSSVPLELCTCLELILHWFKRRKTASWPKMAGKMTTFSHRDIIEHREGHVADDIWGVTHESAPLLQADDAVTREISLLKRLAHIQSAPRLSDQPNPFSGRKNMRTS
jgi:hypothetical protein